MQLYNVAHNDCPSEDARILRCSSNLKRHLDRLNHEAYNTCWSHINSAVESVIKGARYHRVDSSGPHVRECSRKVPLVGQYFVGPKADISLEEEEQQMFSHKGKLFMAHNGLFSEIILHLPQFVTGTSISLRLGHESRPSH